MKDFIQTLNLSHQKYSNIRFRLSLQLNLEKIFEIYWGLRNTLQKHPLWILIALIAKVGIKYHSIHHQILAGAAILQIWTTHWPYSQTWKIFQLLWFLPKSKTDQKIWRRVMKYDQTEWQATQSKILNEPKKFVLTKSKIEFWRLFKNSYYSLKDRAMNYYALIYQKRRVHQQYKFLINLMQLGKKWTELFFMLIKVWCIPKWVLS